MNVFEILEISPTDDKREIKKAYARLVKKYHPEEHPQKWKEIHDAYLMALKMSDCSASIPSQAISVPMPDIRKSEERAVEEPENKKQSSLQNEIDKHLQRIHELEQEREKQQKEPENKKQSSLQNEIDKHLQRIHELEQEREENPEDKMEDIFNRIDEFAEAARENSQKEQQELLQAAMKETELISKKKHLSTKEWKAFFHKEEYQSVIRQGEFLYDLADQLKGHIINKKLYCFLMDQLQIIKQCNISIHEIPQKRGAYDPYQMIELQLKTAYRKIDWHKIKIFAGIVILLSICIALSYFDKDSEKEKQKQEILEEKAGYVEIINWENQTSDTETIYVVPVE